MTPRTPLFPADTLLGKDDVDAALADAKARNDYSRYWAVKRKQGNKDQVEAWRLIADGKGTFKFRCGGLRGPVHRVRISPSGDVAFPDHLIESGEVSDVLAAIGGEKTAPTCAEVKVALGAPDHKGLVPLWGGTLSDLPGWAQALEEVRDRRRTAHDSTAADRETRSWVDGYKVTAAAQISRDGEALQRLGRKGCGVEWVEADKFTPGNYYTSKTDYEYDAVTGDCKNRVLERVSLPWPDGYLAFQYCRLTAKHGDHFDFIPQASSAPGSIPFRPAETLVALAVCGGKWDDKGALVKAPGVRAALLRRTGSEWEVAEL
jgi:hypothetical protein